MTTKLHGHTKRRERAIKLWRKIAADYESGIEVEKIVKKHKCTLQHVYWCMRELKKIDS